MRAFDLLMILGAITIAPHLSDAVSFVLAAGYFGLAGVSLAVRRKP